MSLVDVYSTYSCYVYDARTKETKIELLRPPQCHVCILIGIRGIVRKTENWANADNQTKPKNVLTHPRHARPAPTQNPSTSDKFSYAPPVPGT